MADRNVLIEKLDEYCGVAAKSSSTDFESEVSKLAMHKGLINYELLMWRISYLLRHMEDAENLPLQYKDEKRQQLDFLAYYLIQHQGVKPEKCKYFNKTAEALLLKAQQYSVNPPDTYCYKYSELSDYKRESSRALVIVSVTLFFTAIASVTAAAVLTMTLFAPILTSLLITVGFFTIVGALLGSQQFNKNKMEHSLEDSTTKHLELVSSTSDLNKHSAPQIKADSQVKRDLDAKYKAAKVRVRQGEWFATCQLKLGIFKLPKITETTATTATTATQTQFSINNGDVKRQLKM